MRLKAYILAADPAWIEASVLSYYDIVEEIVVSYDENRMGWTGVSITVDECLERLRAIDREGKMRYSPGRYARLDHTPMDNETYQRQCALDEASQGVDWVLQLDTDEVLTNVNEFLSCLLEADTKCFGGMDYPARWLYQQLGDGKYLEACSRFWGITAGYPGPVAVKANTVLRHARQCDISLFRADFKAINTDPWHSKGTPVHRIIDPDAGILHYSMIRTEQQMLQKTSSFGHAKDHSWHPEIRRWIWCGKHPRLAMLLTLILPKKHKNQLRIAYIPAVFQSVGRGTLVHDSISG